MARPVRLGLIGTGVAARELYLPVWPGIRSRIELVACTNRTLHKAHGYAELARIPKVVASAEELIELPEVEAVLVSLPIEAQPKVVLRALARGKPVLSEKPVAPSVARGERLVREASRLSVPWLVAENFAFLDTVLRIQHWVERGRLGAIRLAQVHQFTVMDRKNPYFHTPWRQAPRFRGAFVLDAGVHLAHALRRCLGMPIEISSLSAGLCPGLPAPDTAVAALRFPGGTLGTWNSCFGARREGPMLELFGSKASAALFWHEAVLSASNGRKTAVTSKRDSFAAEFVHFADVVRRGVSPRVTPEEALLDLRIAERVAAPRETRTRRQRSSVNIK
jgi:predicted dehydrogenase